MAYNTKDLLKKALAAIEKNKLFFIEDVAAFLPCARSTFYEHFSDKSDDRKKIDELLERNRIEVKSSLRSKWYKSDAPALQLGLYKLICNTDERNALSMSKVDVTSGGEKLPAQQIMILPPNDKTDPKAE